jgi:predicted NAD/FAD-dependent oxidoreductase
MSLTHGGAIAGEREAAQPAFARRQPLQVAVIGAGIAGLVATQALSEAGHDVVVLDKGRGPGGRASSRRRAGFSFDHGAQYFTARDERFRILVNAWLRGGVVARWQPRLAVCDTDGLRESPEESERYVGVPGMSAMAGHLAEDQQIRPSVRVARLERVRHDWRIMADDGEVVATADTVILAVPPAQAVPLLTATPELLPRVQSVTMRPCWAVMLGFAKPLPVAFDGVFLRGGPLSWVARNSSKPGREGGEAWVLHASAEWSEQNLERDAGQVTDLLRAEFTSRLVGSELPALLHSESHRWRYAQPDPALPLPCLFDDGQRIGVAGDWCGGPRIEGAFLSGMALAKRVLDRTGADRGGFAS